MNSCVDTNSRVRKRMWSKWPVSFRFGFAWYCIVQCSLAWTGSHTCKRSELPRREPARASQQLARAKACSGYSVVYFGCASQTWSRLGRKSDFQKKNCVGHFGSIFVVKKHHLPTSEKWFIGFVTNCWSIFSFETSPGDHHKPRCGNPLKARNLCWFSKKIRISNKKALDPQGYLFWPKFCTVFRLTTSSWSQGDQNTLYYCVTVQYNTLECGAVLYCAIDSE